VSALKRATSANLETWGDTNCKVAMGRELGRMGEKLYAWVVGIEMRKGSKGRQDRKERLRT
jgi:hypothetical protein